MLIAGLFDCSNEDVVKIIKLIKTFLEILQIVVPIGLIFMGSVDLGKAVVSTDESAIKKAQKVLINRFIAAVLVFLVAAFVVFVTGFFGGTDWKNCWQSAYITILNHI